jgi:hypothetical protein
MKLWILSSLKVSLIYFAFPIIILSFFAVWAQSTKKANDKIPKPPENDSKEVKKKEKSVEERLKSYFYSREVKPAVIVNNLDDGARDEKEEIIDISNHKIVWYHSFTETKIKINDDPFSLKNQKTLNAVSDERENVDFANNWDQIKLFKFGERELIGISMYNDPCTGIGCRFRAFLIYDLKTKSKNFFGTYRFLLDREFGLYDFGLDGKLDFLSGTYDGKSNGVGEDFTNIYEIFTMDKNGIFRLQADKNGKPYYLKRVYTEEDYDEIDGRFEQYWIEDIDQ